MKGKPIALVHISNCNYDLIYDDGNASQISGSSGKVLSISNNGTHAIVVLETPSKQVQKELFDFKTKNWRTL